MRPLLVAFGRAFLSQLQLRMLLLTIIPLLISIAIWGLILWLTYQPMIDATHSYFAANDGFRISGHMLDWLGLPAIKTVIVPLLVIWALLPLMMLTAVLCITGLSMPLIVKHAAGRHYPELAARKGGSFLGSMWRLFFSLLAFLFLWWISLPLSAIFPLGFIIQPALWGWLAYRVLAYGALAEHADAQEINAILRAHRWPLLAIGAISGAVGAAPTLLWLGGVSSVVLFPFWAPLSIWFYLLVFAFSGLWFQYYCLSVLEASRAKSL